MKSGVKKMEVDKMLDQMKSADMPRQKKEEIDSQECERKESRYDEKDQRTSRTAYEDGKFIQRDRAAWSETG